MPGSLPTDVAFESEYQQYVVYNYHKPAWLAQTAAVLGLVTDDQPRILLLAGERHIGRQYLVKAVGFGLRAAGAAVQILPLNFNDYDPEHGAPEAFINAQLVHLEGARASALAGLLKNAKVETQLPLLRWFLISATLKLELPLAQLSALFQQALAGPPRMWDETLHRLLERLCKTGLLVLHVVDNSQLPITLRGRLLDEIKLLPPLRLVFSCDPATPTEQVVLDGTVQRLELVRLQAKDCRALIQQHYQPNTFPEELADALWRASGGFPAHLAIKVYDLAKAGAFFRDSGAVWRLTEGLEAEACIRQFTLDFYRPVETALAQARVAQVGALKDFLDSAALCGDYAPVNLILHVLQVQGEDQDRLFDFIDDTLLEQGSIPPVA